MFGGQLTSDKKKEFEDLLMQNINAMYGLAYHLTLNAEEAKDLVQDASLRAYRFFDKFEPGTNFKGWVLTILRNTFINDYRRKKSQPQKVDVENLENLAGAEDLEISFDKDERFGETLQKHVESLPEEMRTVISLYYAEDLSYKEIADVMGCPVGTVMSRLFQAKKMLKVKISKSVHKS